MTGNNKLSSALSASNGPLQANGNINQMLEQLHADFDPVYSMLMNYQCAVMEVETKFNVLNNRLSLQDEHNPIESIKSRVKSLDSIICSFVDDIYRIEECFLAQEDVTLVKRKDYIRDPKPSGYRSLHLIIKTPVYTENGKKDMLVEIQMRTIAMDFWASLEHKLRYKKNLNPRTAEELARELEACAEESASLDEKMLRIRDRIAKD